MLKELERQAEGAEREDERKKFGMHARQLRTIVAMERECRRTLVSIVSHQHPQRTTLRR